MGGGNLEVTANDTVKQKINGKDFVFIIHKASQKGKEIGAAVESTTQGFGGDLKVLVGFNATGNILGYTILSTSETPGLGAKAQDQPFISQYNGKSIDNEIIVSKSSTGAENEIVAISGATITSQAVTDGINLAVEVFNDNFK